MNALLAFILIFIVEAASSPLQLVQRSGGAPLPPSFMIDFATPRPLAEAVDSLSAKTPIGSELRSADWARVPQQLRETAFFSSAVESARFLQVAQDRLLELVKLQRRTLADGSEGAYLSREKFVTELRALANELGLDTTRDETERGTLRDITSDARLELIFDIQTQRAAEFAKWKMDQDPDVLDAYPAQELVRIESREVPRRWTERWREAGGTLRQGRMVALKNDRIWTRLSRFGSPFPPFDFNSGMGLEDVSRREAEKLGLLQRDERVKPQTREYTDGLEASVRGLGPRMISALSTIFGEQVQIADGTAKWKGGRP